MELHLKKHISWILIGTEHVVPPELKGLVSLFQSLTTLARRFTTHGSFILVIKTTKIGVSRRDYIL